VDVEIWNALMGPAYESLSRLEFALGHGADVQNLDMDNTSPLAEALATNRLCVKLLVEAGAKAANTYEEKGMFRGYIVNAEADTLQYLFNEGIFDSLEIGDLLEDLHYIVRTCKRDAVQIVRICIDRALDKGANLHEIITTDEGGYSLLHCAVIGDGGGGDGDIRIAMVQMLIHYGADVLQKSHSGETAEQYAIGRHRIFTKDGPRKFMWVKLVAVLDKSLAFAMGNHDRLGSESMLTGLDPELVRVIRELSLLYAHH
jgi:ankyrin repeat protein